MITTYDGEYLTDDKALSLLIERVNFFIDEECDPEDFNLFKQYYTQAIKEGFYSDDFDPKVIVDNDYINNFLIMSCDRDEILEQFDNLDEDTVEGAIVAETYNYALVRA